MTEKLRYFAAGLWIAAVAAASGCGATPGARPDDMSAAEHRDHSAKHDKVADKHEGMFDESAPPEENYGFTAEYSDMILRNPTAVHLEHARMHRVHAEDHLAAAVALENFEEAECKAFPPKTRAACPLINTVEAMEDTPKGAKVRLVSGVNPETALAHIRCHLAFGRTQGRKGMDRCPLYLKGVTVKAGESPGIIILEVDDPGMTDELRKRTRGHVGQ